MEQESFPLFSMAALSILDRMPFDPDARGNLEIMSGGLLWPDEFPAGGSAEWEVVRPQWVYRYLLADRRALTLGEDREEFRPVWEQVSQHAPNWPGLRPERRGDRAARRLRAALRQQDKCLNDLETHLDSDGSDCESFDKPDAGRK